MKQLLEVFDFSIRLNTMVFRIISKINLKKKMHGNVFVRLNSIYLKDLPTDKRATIINTNSTSLLSKYLWNHKLPLNIQKCIRILPVLEQVCTCRGAIMRNNAGNYFPTDWTTCQYFIISCFLGSDRYSSRISQKKKEMSDFSQRKKNVRPQKINAIS